MMKKKLRSLALFMTFVLLFSSVSFAVSAEPAPTAAPTRVMEVENLRETNAETYLMSDGSYECVVYAYDKYYRAADNTLQLTSSKIVPAAAAERSGKLSTGKAQYKNAANAFDVHFAGSGTPEISIAYQGASVTFSPVVPLGTSSRQATGFAVGKVTACKTLDTLTYTGDNTVTYSNAFPNTDLVYVLENNTLKEYIILNNANASNAFQFSFTLDSVTLESKGKYAEFVDQNGTVLFSLDSLFAVDANGAFTEALTYTFTPVQGTNTVTVTVTLDKAFLTKAAFPVIIDPTVVISSVETADACVCSYTPDTNYQSVYQLRTGMDTDFGIRRTYIKFDIPTSIPTSNITGANLHIEKLSGASPLIKAYRCLGLWSPATITWDYKPTYTTVNESTMSALYDTGSTWYTMDVLSIVQDWVSGIYTNYGFVIKDLNEVDSDHWTTWYSSDAPAPHKPKLYISYVTESTPLSVASSISDYISAGYTNQYAFTPNASSMYSIWTTGTTDTHLSVYSDASMATLVGQADGGGHSLNACLTLPLTAGITYYIALRGGTTAASGLYTLALYKGLPMSGGELPNYISIFNTDDYETLNNCYTYALSVWKNPITGELFDFKGLDPGKFAGIDLVYSNDMQTMKANIVSAVRADCIEWGGSASDFYEVSATTMVPAGYYKVALVYKPANSTRPDYHWYRQVSDLDGAWVHKHGAYPVQTTDESGNTIFSPEDADRGNYTEFMGYFALKPPPMDELID